MGLEQELANRYVMINLHCDESEPRACGLIRAVVDERAVGSDSDVQPVAGHFDEYTPDAAPTFWRMVKRSQVDAVARIAASA